MFLYKFNHVLQYGNILQYTQRQYAISTHIVTSLLAAHFDFTSFHSGFLVLGYNFFYTKGVFG